MTLIHWTPALEVGHPDIDADHRILVDLVNQLAAATGTIDMALANLDALLSHAAAHFGREEALMQEIAYQQTSRHAKEHLHLADDLIEYRQALRRGDVSATTLGRFVRDWFMEHAAFSDRYLAEAITRHHAKQRQP